MNYYLLIPLFLISICFIPIKLEGRVSFNIFDLSGAFGIFFYGIKMTHQQVWIKHKKIMMKKDKSIESKEIDFNSSEVILLKKFIGQIKDKTRLRMLMVFYNLGTGDAFTSSMLAGYVNVSLLTFFTSIKNSKPTASCAVYDTVSFNEQIAQFAVKIILSISLFDIVYSFIYSVILTRREKKKKEKKWNFTAVMKELKIL